MRAVAIALLVTGCFSKPGRPGGDPGDVTAYDITFDTSGLQTLTGFPALIPLTPTTFDYASVDDPAHDLRFIDADTQAALPFDVDEWNPGAESLIWVRVPEIRGGSTDDGVRLEIGTAVGSVDAVATWADYEAVWHLSSASQSYPSRVGGYTGTGMAVVDVAGQLGRGAMFSNASQSTIDIAGGPNLFDAWDQFTLELWINTTPDAGNEPGFLDPQNGGGPVHGCRMLQNPLRTQCDITFTSGTTFQDVGVESGQWTYVVYTSDSTQQAVYGNGMRQAIETVTPPLDQANEQIHLGGFNAIDGMLDEVRISKTGRSADYVAAQYRSMIRTFTTVMRVP